MKAESTNSHLDTIPDMLCRVHIRTVGWPRHDGKFLRCKPSGGELGGVFGIVVVHEDDVANGKGVIVDGAEKGLLQYLHVLVCGHVALYAMQPAILRPGLS